MEKQHYGITSDTQNIETHREVKSVPLMFGTKLFSESSPTEMVGKPEGKKIPTVHVSYILARLEVDVEEKK